MIQNYLDINIKLINIIEVKPVLDKEKKILINH